MAHPVLPPPDLLRRTAPPQHREHDQGAGAAVPEAGVRVAFAGHEHNFQLSRADGIDDFLFGAGGKLREEPPEHFVPAQTVAWSAQSHLLLVRVDGETLSVTPYAGLTPDGRPHPMTALTRATAWSRFPSS